MVPVFSIHGALCSHLMVPPPPFSQFQPLNDAQFFRSKQSFPFYRDFATVCNQVLLVGQTPIFPFHLSQSTHLRAFLLPGALTNLAALREHTVQSRSNGALRANYPYPMKMPLFVISRFVISENTHSRDERAACIKDGFALWKMVGICSSLA